MLTLLPALITRIVVNPLSNVFQKNLTAAGFHPLAVNFASYAVLALLCLPLAIATDWSAYTDRFWLWAAIMGLIGSVGNAFLVMAMKSGELSILGPINAYKSVVGMLTGIILLHEIPSLWGIAGTIVIICGTYCIFGSSGNKNLNRHTLTSPAVRYRIYALIFAAIEAVISKRVIMLSDVNTTFILWCAAGALFSGLILPIVPQSRTAPARFNLKTAAWLILLPLSIGTMQYCTNLVFSLMEVGYALALFQLSSIVSIMFGRFFYHETNIGRKLIGSTIMIAGAAMIILL